MNPSTVSALRGTKPTLTFRYECKHALRAARTGLPMNLLDWGAAQEASRLEIKEQLTHRWEGLKWNRRGEFHITIHVPQKTKDLTCFTQFFLEVFDGPIFRKLKDINTIGCIRGEPDIEHPICIVVNNK